jgi:hypothetical protein
MDSNFSVPQVRKSYKFRILCVSLIIALLMIALPRGAEKLFSITQPSPVRMEIGDSAGVSEGFSEI